MSDTRQAILKHLLHEKPGLTVDELCARLSISRSGVQQHLANLQRDRLVEETATRNAGTGGRPSRVFILTEIGYEQFPRHYDLVSSLTLRKLKETLGDDILKDTLAQVAEELYGGMDHRVAGKEGAERLQAVVEIMNELGYEATADPVRNEISAVNCVYHHLANEVREICHLDLELLRRLTGSPIQHTRCMADGDHQCVFKPTGTS